MPRRSLQIALVLAAAGGAIAALLLWPKPPAPEVVFEFPTHDKTAFDVTRQDFTIEAWFRLPPGYTATGNGCEPIASKGPNPGYELCALTGGRS